MKRGIAFILALCLMISFGVVGAYAGDEPAAEEPTAADDPFDRVTLDAGAYHFLAVKEDGTVIDELAEDGSGQCSGDGWTDIVSVAGGHSYSLGLRSDGTVVMADSDEYGVSGAEDWTDVVDIDAGYQHCVGLRSDGKVLTAGYNGDGQCDTDSWTDIVDVAAGAWHTIGLRSDGTVVATGQNDKGQCNVSAWTDIVAIDGNRCCTVGLRADGTVVYAGGFDASHRQVLDAMTGWSNVAAVRAFNDAAVLGVTADGKILDINGRLPDSGIQLDDTDQAVFAAQSGALISAVLMQDGTVRGGSGAFDGVKLQMPTIHTPSAEAPAAKPAAAATAPVEGFTLRKEIAFGDSVDTVGSKLGRGLTQTNGYYAVEPEEIAGIPDVTQRFYFDGSGGLYAARYVTGEARKLDSDPVYSVYDETLRRYNDLCARLTEKYGEPVPSDGERRSVRGAAVAEEKANYDDHLASLEGTTSILSRFENSFDTMQWVVELPDGGLVNIDVICWRSLYYSDYGRLGVDMADLIWEYTYVSADAQRQIDDDI